MLCSPFPAVGEVVGAVEDGKQAVNAVLTLNPDVLLIDISMPVLNGLHAARQLQTADCRAKVIFLTIYEGRDFLDAAFAAGAFAHDPFQGRTLFRDGRNFPQ